MLCSLSICFESGNVVEIIQIWYLFLHFISADSGTFESNKDHIRDPKDNASGHRDKCTAPLWNSIKGFLGYVLLTSHCFPILPS